MMKPEIKEKWVAELRGGKRLQGKGCLRQETLNHECEYCCLGVLAEIAVDEGVARWDDNTLVGPDGRASAGYLIPAVMDWASVDSRDPVVKNEVNRGMPLSSLNDSGKTFSEIADLIEAQL